MTEVLDAPATKKAAGTKLTLSLAALQKALATVAPAVERKTTIPVLSTVRIKQQENGVEFIATNLDLAIRVFVTGIEDAKAADPILLPALKLDAFSRLLEGDSVSLTCSGKDDRRVTLKCGRSITKLPMLDAVNFPLTKFSDGDAGIPVTQAHAERLFGFTSFAISDESSRYTLDGALMKVAGGKLAMIATDGHRLARYTVPAPDVDPVTMMLPSAMIRAAAKIIDGDADQYLVLDGSGDVVCANVGDKTGEIALTHSKMTGQFPNYEAVMPQKTAATIRVDADAMKHALKRCLTFADERSGAIVMKISLEEIGLRGASTDTGETDETVDVISASTGDDFEPFAIGFRAQYLLDGFSRLAGEVEMRFSAYNGQNSMMLFASPKDGETFEYVVMPMRV